MHAIEEAIQKLAPLDREIVVLFHKENLSYQEMSKILDLPITTIKTRLHRARIKLKEILKNKYSRNKISDIDENKF